jgi:hypothetical protein
MVAEGVLAHASLHTCAKTTRVRIIRHVLEQGEHVSEHNGKDRGAETSEKAWPYLAEEEGSKERWREQRRKQWGEGNHSVLIVAFENLNLSTLSNRVVVASEPCISALLSTLCPLRSALCSLLSALCSLLSALCSLLSTLLSALGSLLSLFCQSWS